MKRVNLIVLGFILMMGLVSALDVGAPSNGGSGGGGASASGRSLYNTVNISLPANVVAGSEFFANFSFDYLDNHVNPDNSPLIIQLNFSSEDENYPVWRNDFEVSGRIERYALWGYIHTETVYFECDNSEVQVIDHPLDIQTVLAENGTFYCYNDLGDLQLEEHDEIYLDVVSNYAIYPGEYELTASMFYLTDERAPFVNITNKDLFDRYYRENDNVLVSATINDASGISGRWASAMINASNGSEEFFLVPQALLGGIYPFSQNTPVDISEDDYDLFVFSEDEYGNVGNDSVTLKIDRSAPEISLTSGIASINNRVLIGFVNVIDLKSGVNKSSVEYRFREMNGSNICPENGVGNWDCYDSGWIGMDYVEEDEYRFDFDSFEAGLNGEYWLQVRASDILGNTGVLE